MQRSISSNSRRGFRLFEVVLLSFLLMIVFGLLLPGCSGKDPRIESQANLKQIGLALENYIVVNNSKLPPCEIKGGKNAPGYFEPLLPYMESNYKTFMAPLDPNLSTGGQHPLSYAIPRSWGEKPFSGKMVMPDSFKKRGVSNSISCVEASCGANGTKQVTGTSTMYDSEKGITTAAVGPWDGQANAFSPAGCQAVMMDGSVRNFTAAQSPDLITASQPNKKE